MSTFTSFYEDDSGATAIEYSLIALFIALVLVASAMTVGSNLSNVFNKFDGVYH